MKTSQKTLLGFVGAVLFGVLLLLAGTRLVLSNYIVEDGDQSRLLSNDGSNAVGRSMPMDQLTEFTSIEVSGTAEVTIKQGDHWSVDVQVEPGKQQMMSNYVENGRLVLSSSNYKPKAGWAWLSGNGVPFEAQITMPKLDAVTASGRVQVNLERLQQDKLKVELSGTCSLDGEGSEIVDLNLIASGANNVDFTNAELRNAHIAGSGANNIELNMAGGTLSGTLSGVGNVEYSGELSESTLQLSGMGQLRENQ